MANHPNRRNRALENAARDAGMNVRSLWEIRGLQGAIWTVGYSINGKPVIVQTYADNSWIALTPEPTGEPKRMLDDALGRVVASDQTTKFDYSNSPTVTTTSGMKYGERKMSDLSSREKFATFVDGVLICNGFAACLLTLLAYYHSDYNQATFWLLLGYIIFTTKPLSTGSN